VSTSVIQAGSRINDDLAHHHHLNLTNTESSANGFDLNSEPLLDPSFFGCDFTLFDDIDLGSGALLSTPDSLTGSYAPSPNTTDTVNNSFTSTTTEEDDFLNFLASPSTAVASSTSSIFTPPGSEEPILPPVINHALTTPPLSSCLTPLDAFSPSNVTSSASRKRKAEDLTSPQPKELAPIIIDEDDDDRDVKRKRNTAAARRYRQKKQDRMKELEEELEAVKAEREHFRQLAIKNEMEAQKWHSVVQLMKGK